MRNEATFLSTSKSTGGAPRVLVRTSRLSWCAWALLAYLVFVIQFGAWVRITGSGAGCGNHWPTCHGQIIPRSPEASTIVEYTHRITSGLLGLFVIAITLWATLSFRGWHRVRIAAWVTLAFTVLEAAIGAKLVLAGLVARDDSVARAVVIALHLISTFSLTASAGLVAWWSRPSPNADSSFVSSRAKVVLALSCGGLLLASVAGAITALGDTLFPVSPTLDTGLLARLREDAGAASHFLVRLRVVHPALAVCIAAVLIALPSYLDSGVVGRRSARLLVLLRWAVVLQVAVGAANIAIGAPGWIQLVHLFCAQGVWLLLVLALAETVKIRRA